MTIDIILYICIYVCLCIVLFDVLFIIEVSFSNRALSRRTVYLEKKLDEICKINRNINNRNIRYSNMLSRKLTNVDWLLSYLYAFQNIKQKFGNESKEIDKLEHFNILLLRAISTKYINKSNEEKAFFAYITYLLVPNYNRNAAYFRPMNFLCQEIAKHMEANSVYVRSNVFRAIVKIGNINYIYYVLTCLNDSLHLINSKFFSDYLVEFEGDRDALNGLFLNRILEFSPSVQVLIINYLRLLPKVKESEKYYPMIYKILCIPEINGETIISVIRYFGKHKYDNVYSKLLDYLNKGIEQVNGYNYAAIAASSLQIYPSEKTKDALLQQLSSPDWYVRFNCADGLISMGVDYEKIILESKDQYAKDILIHRSEVYKLKKGAKFKR